MTLFYLTRQPKTKKANAFVASRLPSEARQATVEVINIDDDDVEVTVPVKAKV